MSIIVISDIFGRTAPLRHLCRTLHPDCKIIDPYKGQRLKFKTEDAAYEYFTRHVGLDVYTSHIKKQLTLCRENPVIVAFSVGASCLWRLSAGHLVSPVKKAFCFYGSQIRNFVDIVPRFKIELIFPDSESHFNVDELIEQISKHGPAICKKAEGLHGFMNQRSQNFDPELFHFYTGYLKQQIGLTG